jgi:hypothetical protein
VDLPSSKTFKKMGFKFYISNLHFIQVIEATKRLSERENIGKVILTP